MATPVTNPKPRKRKPKSPKTGGGVRLRPSRVRFISIEDVHHRVIPYIVSSQYCSTRKERTRWAHPITKDTVSGDVHTRSHQGMGTRRSLSCGGSSSPWLCSMLHYS